MPVTFADVAKAEYILLTTFTKDGRPKPTAIWAAPDGDRPGGRSPRRVVEGQAHPQHPAGDHRGVRPRAATPRARRSRPPPRSWTSRATAPTYDAIGKRYGLVGKVFNVFSQACAAA